MRQTLTQRGRAARWRRVVSASVDLVVFVALIGASGHSHAGGIPEPPAIIFGGVIVDGQPVSSGVRIEARVEGRSMSSYTLGDNPAAGDLYVLRIPLVGAGADEVVPLDAARVDDEVALFADGVDTGDRVVITVRAQVTRVDLRLGSTTSTTVPTGGTCGDPVTSQVASQAVMGIPDTQANAVTASDALFALKSAVGAEMCRLCVCDVNGSGSVTATDALVLLNMAVGLSVPPLACPPCT